MPIEDFKDDPYLSLVRPLVEAYLGFYRVGSRHIQALGLTPGQFDVIAELEGTEGLTCAQLSQQTLTTKGTLTGILDRLEHRGLIQRGQIGGDRRAIRVQLTEKGIEMVQRVFPAHAEFIRPYFSRALNASEVQEAKRLLVFVRDSFNGSLKGPSSGSVEKGKPSTNSGIPRLSKTADKKRRAIQQKTKN